jgi:hypothetical protein
MSTRPFTLSRRARRFMLYGVLGCGVVLILWTDVPRRLAQMSSAFKEAAPQAAVADKPIVRSIIEQFFGTAFFALISFLLYDRWKEMRDDVRDVKANIDETLRETAKGVQDRLAQQIDDKLRKVDALQSQAATLLEDFPWLVGLKELDFIPNIPSIRVVIQTVTRFIDNNNKIMAYEYLYSWLKEPTRLEGSYEDLYDLVEFCETVLGDQHLANLFVQRRMRADRGGVRLLPDVLARTIREGYVVDAAALERDLCAIMTPRWWQVSALWSKHPRNLRRNKRFALDAWKGLVLFYAAVGDGEKAERLLVQGGTLAQALQEVDQWRWLEVEADWFLGNCERALSHFIVLSEGRPLPVELAYLKQVVGGPEKQGAGNVQEAAKSTQTVKEGLRTLSHDGQHEPGRFPSRENSGTSVEPDGLGHHGSLDGPGIERKP